MPVQELKQPVIPLQIPQDDQLRKELGLIKPENLGQQAENPEVEATANEWVEKILKESKGADLSKQQGIRDSIDSIGGDIERQLAKGGRSEMLREQVGKMMDSMEGKSVGKSLIDLKIKTDSVNPNRFNILEPGGLGRFLALIPFFGITLNKYVTKWQTVGAVIDAIMKSIESGAEQLTRDNGTLKNDQANMRKNILLLQKTIAVLAVVDQKMVTEISSLAVGSDERKFLEEEVLFGLRQRAEDLSSTLGINQNGFMSFEFIVRTNRELIRGARRCVANTKLALDIVVTQLVALIHQKRELEGIKAANETTAGLMVQGSEQMRTQGVEIYKMSATAMIPIEALKTSYENINAAYADVAQFKQVALPQMAERVRQLKEMAADAEKKIQQLERGNQAASTLEFSLEATGAKNAA